VVESRAGAGSSIAAEFVARAPADGYTLFIGTSSNVTNAAISSNLRFDFAKDFAPITPLTGLPLILAVHPSLGVTSVEELIALARSKPGELTYASVGSGTVPHLSTELFCVRTNVKLVHVPYQGSPPAVTDLLAGRVSMMLGVASTIMPHVEAGRLKGLASGSAKRPHIAPNLPTIAEAGLPDFETSVWFGLVAPAGTPHAVIKSSLPQPTGRSSRTTSSSSSRPKGSSRSAARPRSSADSLRARPSNGPPPPRRPG
jgi:tripartite-type tricarboxylate transporter receptor subunit TctC